ncbi:MAG: quinolinate synthase NadA [Chloroflexi bacterium]|nr:quinolinate synthase NadA [Chloroflexota bacterium]
MPTGTRVPTVPITELEQSEFCAPDSLQTRPLEEELSANVRWQRLPRSYMRMSAEELDERIAAAKARLGTDLVILGHHYQRDEIIKFADFRGDSFKLSQQAASRGEARYIVFCGVHFMAETADILSGEEQQVILPNITAGCSMADMAPSDDVHDCWEDLSQVVGEERLIPITYMNSTAAVKAMCGHNEGIVCTSSNAEAAFRWALQRGRRIVFFPDQHLGRNTGLKLGIPLEEMVVWNPFKSLGGLTPERIRGARLILWQGHCSVHTRFRVQQIQQARARHPGVHIVVHPECTMEVVQAADDNGSTEKIVRVVSQAPPGSIWGIGTEINLVNRLARENPDKTIFCLDPVVCPCSTMYRIHPAYLAWVLEELLEGRVVNRITVDPETRRYARVALERMLQVT